MSRLEPIDFTDLPGWSRDDHLAAFEAFTRSAHRLVALLDADPCPLDDRSRALIPVCRLAIAAQSAIRSSVDARHFFEAHFSARRVVHDAPTGLLTAYYEPIIIGARVATERFAVPIYRRPADLVNIVDESQRGVAGTAFTHMRRTPAGLVPYPTRADIDGGALDDQGLELFFLEDPVDVFFLQVQGSGQIELEDGTRVRVAYDGKNGHPYTSIGRHLIDAGIFETSQMSLDALGAWLRADRARGLAVMQKNASYVFFRELAGAQAEAPLGVLDIPLTTGRSLAIDPVHHAIGTPIYVSAETLTHVAPALGFHSLMIAQDVGSAIKGPERGDLYLGTGEAAGHLAGITKHPGNLFVLVPRAAGTETKATNKAP